MAFKHGLGGAAGALALIAAYNSQCGGTSPAPSPLGMGGNCIDAKSAALILLGAFGFHAPAVRCCRLRDPARTCRP